MRNALHASRSLRSAGLFTGLLFSIHSQALLPTSWRLLWVVPWLQPRSPPRQQRGAEPAQPRAGSGSGPGHPSVLQRRLQPARPAATAPRLLGSSSAFGAAASYRRLWRVSVCSQSEQRGTSRSWHRVFPGNAAAPGRICWGTAASAETKLREKVTMSCQRPVCFFPVPLCQAGYLDAVPSSWWGWVVWHWSDMPCEIYYEIACWGIFKLI